MDSIVTSDSNRPVTGHLQSTAPGRYFSTVTWDDNSLPFLMRGPASSTGLANPLVLPLLALANPLVLALLALANPLVLALLALANPLVLALLA